MASELLSILPRNKTTFRIYSLILVIIAILAFIFFPTEDFPEGIRGIIIGFMLFPAVLFYVFSFRMDRTKGNPRFDSSSGI